MFLKISCGHFTMSFVYYAAKIIHFYIANIQKITPRSVIRRKNPTYRVYSEVNFSEKTVS